MAGFEEKGFNCYYLLGDGRERIQAVIVSLRESEESRGSQSGPGRTAFELTLG